MVGGKGAMDCREVARKVEPMILDDAIKADETLAHVGGDEEAGGGRERDHETPLKVASKRKNWSSAAVCPWTVSGPSGRSGSRRRPSEDFGEGSMKSSTIGGTSVNAGASAGTHW